MHRRSRSQTVPPMHSSLVVHASRQALPLQRKGAQEVRVPSRFRTVVESAQTGPAHPQVPAPSHVPADPASHAHGSPNTWSRHSPAAPHRPLGDEPQPLELRPSDARSLGRRVVGRALRHQQVGELLAADDLVHVRGDQPERPAHARVRGDRLDAEGHALEERSPELGAQIAKPEAPRVERLGVEELCARERVLEDVLLRLVEELAGQRDRRRVDPDDLTEVRDVRDAIARRRRQDRWRHTLEAPGSRRRSSSTSWASS